MGDTGEDYKVMRQRKKERGRNNLASANKDGWKIHSTYHWSREVNGQRLDYWPTKNKFQYDGRIMTGDVIKFIKRERNKCHNTQTS